MREENVKEQLPTCTVRQVNRRRELNSVHSFTHGSFLSISCCPCHRPRAHMKCP